MFREICSERNLLFFKEDLVWELHARQQEVPSRVDSIPKDQFLIASDQELTNYVVDKLTLKPITLHKECETITQQETKVDMSHNPICAFLRGHKCSPSQVHAIKVIINIPFSGDEWILQVSHHQYFADYFPSAKIKDGLLQIKIELPYNIKPQAFQSQYKNKVEPIHQYIEFARKQVNEYNASLPDWVQEAIKSRRDRLAHHSNIAKLLDIPLAPQDGALSIKPVKVHIRRPPDLPVPPKTGLKSEPGIADETYEHILQFIRHQGRTFERTPKTYSVHCEEGLRDIILSQLNGHFQGAAMAEAFRYKGKTDICIEENNRAAFIGECKLWTGPAGMSHALDQLLRYLTWRDSKAALIVFNKHNQDFTRVRDSVPKTLREHPLFVRDLPCCEGSEGEWRVQMRSAEDEGRRVSIHIFVFDLNIS